jgi:Immunoglobulin-like domain of bacterial spore germination/Sporulation and spore germination
MLGVALRIESVLVSPAPGEGERQRDERERSPKGAGRVRAAAIPVAVCCKPRAGIDGSREKIAAVRVSVVAVVVGVLAAGCGSNSSSVGEGPSTTTVTTVTVTTTQPATTREATVAQPMSLRLYFLAPDGKLAAVSRGVERTPTPGAATLHELIDPPSGLKTEVPAGLRLTIEDGRANVTGARLDPPALAQVVYALTAFPTVRSVNGKTRADVETFVPPILVEQPSPAETVTSPLHVTGNANTFEATFNYKLEDAAGKPLAKDFVTASSGSGTRGTFDFTIPFTVDAPQDGELRVFELSAEDGSVVHQRVIPLRLSP